MKVIPSIDLMGGRVVRLRKGRFDQVSHYEEDAADLARDFRKHVDRLHVVDLDGARAGRPIQVAVLERVVAAFGDGVQIGGGLRTEASIEAALSLAQRAVIGTAAIVDQAMVERLATRYPQRLVVAVDAADGRVKISGWEEDGHMTVDVLVDRLAPLPLAGILYTDIARDGTEVGPNIPATSALSLRCPFDVTASGGVGTLEHIGALAAAPGPIASVVVGRALHEGRFQLSDAVQRAANATSG